MSLCSTAYITSATHDDSLPPQQHVCDWNTRKAYTDTGLANACVDNRYENLGLRVLTRIYACVGHNQNSGYETRVLVHLQPVLREGVLAVLVAAWYENITAMVSAGHGAGL